MSFATLAIAVTGIGVLVLALTAAATALLPLPPVGRAIVALLGLVLTIVAMGVVSNRLTARAIRAEYGDEPEAEVGDGDRPVTDGLG
ncbi:hypothetical protein [Dietzia alimentaria]|uniref:hypothetical protein n=1 Tax=Dietzia alimentaria TaxID=665550 RepID=UPI000299EF98|nr:hypothetical protein [Dietzia alimentaria]